MALMYMLSGSLWIPMLILAFVDINGGQMGMLAFGGQTKGGPDAAAEPRATSPSGAGSCRWQGFATSSPAARGS